MLREILSITGKPGLYRIISHSANRIIVEDLVWKKRSPVSARDKVVSLGDIAMYTDGDDKPLGEILDLLFASQQGGQVDLKSIADNSALSEAFARILPNYDRDRVYPTDIKKLFTWYNILVNAGISEFARKDKDEQEKEE